MKSIYQIVEEQRSAGIISALCTIVSTKGSTPLKTGAKMLITENGDFFGTIGGGQLEKAVMKDAKNIIILGETRLFEHNLLQQHGMCCGGIVQVLIETIFPAEKLFIFGSGHVGRALAFFAKDLDFDVFVIDPREEELNKLDTKIENRLNFSYDQILSKIPFNQQSYIAVMTYDHQLDREIVAYCLKQKHAYLGMIGSKRKVEITKKMFLSTEMYDEKEINQIDMPMGFDIRGKNPEEIAIGILAKIIEVKNKKNTVSRTSTLLSDLAKEMKSEKNIKSYEK